MFQARKKDFQLTWFSGTGAGGQHRNKHQNCCRITHIATGFTETGQEHRERSRNLHDAFRRLAKRLIDHFVKAEVRERFPAPTETIRTYHQPDNRVKDHRSQVTATFDEVVEGDGLAHFLRL